MSAQAHVENMIGTLQKAADSVLAGDRAKAGGKDEHGVERYGGGQKLTDIERVEVGIDTDAGVAVVVLHTADGKNARGVILPHSLHMPKDRELRPGDCHDGVRNAMLGAVEQLADGRA